MLKCILLYLVNIISNTSGGVDYNSGPYIVTFPAMQTRMTFNVSLANNDAFEDNEKFMLTIKPFSLGIITCDPSQATVTIVDIEGKYVCHYDHFIFEDEKVSRIS